MSGKAEEVSNVMCNRIARVFGTALLKYAAVAAIALCLSVPVWAQYLSEVPSTGYATETDEQVTQHFRAGLQLYVDERFREALEQFTETLRLDPDHGQAKEFALRCRQALLSETEAGEPEVEYAPETAAPSPMAVIEDELPSPEQIEEQRIQILLDEGYEYYLAGKYDKAIDAWQQVLLIDPTNKPANDAILDATRESTDEQRELIRQQLQLQTEKIRLGTDEKKLLPSGAGPDGFREFSVRTPAIEKRPQPVCTDFSVEVRPLRPDMKRSARAARCSNSACPR